MAFIQASYTSMALHRPMPFNVILPGDNIFPDPHAFDKPFKTLYLLHGYTAGLTEHLKLTDVQSLSALNNLAVVFPEGENHFYVNDVKGCAAYSDYIGKELVDFTRRVLPLSDKREDTIIGGISMGGFGALINGMRFHETFGHIVAISPALIKNELPLATDEPNHVGSTRGSFESVFGDLDKYPETDMNPAHLAARLKAEGADFPSIYLACGRNDMLCAAARELHGDFLRLGVKHRYVEGPGCHEAIFFYPHLNHGLSFIDLDRPPVMENPFWVD